MANNFDSDFLVDKLARLTVSQRKIQSLSQWCISHMYKAKEIVQIWSRQFHSSPREQRLAFLYLASDIIQNSRRQGAEFVLKFWKVLPDSLRDVIENGKVVERNAALRLIDIWVQRSLFGSRSKILMEGLLNSQSDNVDRKPAGFQMQKHPGVNALDKIISGFHDVYGSQLNEDVVLRKCRYAINFVEKVDEALKEGTVHRGIGKDLERQHAILKECMEQLRVFKSSRESLVTLLREALQEQEYELDQVQVLFQRAEEQSEQARQLLGGPSSAQSRNAAGGEQSSVTYTQKSPPVEKPKENPKTAAAAAATNPTVSKENSAQMPACFHSPFASEGVACSSNVHKLSNDDPSARRAKIDIDHRSYVPAPPHLPLPPPIEPLAPAPPLLPTPPYQVPQYMPTAMPLQSGPYGYNISPPLPPLYLSFIPVRPPASGASRFAPPPNAYYSNSTESGLHGQR